MWSNSGKFCLSIIFLTRAQQEKLEIHAALIFLSDRLIFSLRWSLGAIDGSI